jgi:hypothetical protein
MDKLGGLLKSLSKCFLGAISADGGVYIWRNNELQPEALIDSLTVQEACLILSF